MGPAPSACRPCARAKARCIYNRDSASSSSCLRCVRLRKDCLPQQPARQRAPPLPRTRFDQLEKRVDALFESVSFQKRINLDGNAGIYIPEPHTEQQGRSISANEERHASSSQSNKLPYMERAKQYSASTSAAEETLPDVWPQGEEAESLLTIYYTELGSHFPFVVPPKQDAVSLCRDRPFLFKAMIMAASYQRRPVQKRRGAAFTEDMTRRLLIEGVKTLDLLQGLLIHIAWYQCHLTTSSQITNLLQLAIAVLADLGLNKPSHVNDRRKLIFDSSRSSYGFATNIRPLTNEERRALLGCFYVSSMMSSIFQRVDALQFTLHVAYELQALLDSKEFHSDILLAQLIHIQKLAEQTTQIAPYDEPQHSSVPLIMLGLKSLSTSISDLERSIPLELRDNELLLMHYHSARILLNEISHYGLLWQDPTDIAHSQRLKIMWACLEATKSFFQSFLNLTPHLILTFPYALWGQLAYALLISSRLSLIEIQDWDRDIVSQELPFCTFIDQITEKLNAANAWARSRWLRGGHDAEEDTILDRVSVKLRLIRQWFEEYSGRGRTPCHDQQMAGHPQAVGSLIDISLEDEFWEELMKEFQPSVV